MTPDPVQPSVPKLRCVVGVGFAGLAAAWSLRRAGTEVVVLEARPPVGGECIRDACPTAPWSSLALNSLSTTNWCWRERPPSSASSWHRRA
jgi:cation diffusion facilitator CzcD-associated flavoprotein CzcO